jgi:hypothetical protein
MPALSRPGLALAAVALAALPAGAQPPTPAKAVSGAFLARPAPDQPWRFVAPGAPVPAGELVLGGPESTLDSANGAVRLTFIGDLDGTSPLPVLETAVSLRDAGGADLAVTLDRGRIDLTNRKPDGPARVRLTIRGITADVTLKQPGARVALEVYGRWPKGVPFSREPKPGEGPALAGAALALTGEIELKGPTRQFTLTAPPGPALLLADDTTGFEPRTRHLDKLPDWALPNQSERSQKVRAAAAKFRALAQQKSIGDALDALLNSDDPVERTVGVVLCGALDELPRLGAVLNRTTHPDVWETAVRVLRHWIGRAPGQDQRLYRGLIERAGYKPAEAETVLQLLHSFSDEDLARPATYEMLLDYLESERLPLRGLAYWHLVRLVPEGAKFGFAPLAPKAERDRAVQQWRKLIPKGQVPPHGAGD